MPRESTIWGRKQWYEIVHDHRDEVHSYTAAISANSVHLEKSVVDDDPKIEDEASIDHAWTVEMESKDLEVGRDVWATVET